MVRIDKPGLNLIVKRGGKLVESSLLKRQRLKSIEGLMYLPQKTQTDIIERKRGNVSSADVLKKEVIESVLKSGKRLYQMAEELHISRKTLRN